jgi:hypothetical protein
MFCGVVEVGLARVLLVLYWKTTCVAVPFGFTVPFTVALVVVMPVAAPVVADGATAATGNVVKLRMLPRVVPALFVATTR